MNETERHALIERLSNPGRDRSDPLVFAGRSDELAWLQSMLDEARRGGKGLSCVIEGIPGSGKTALAMEFCRRAEANGAVAVTFGGQRFGRTDAFTRTVLQRGQAIAAADDARFFQRLPPGATVEWLFVVAKVKLPPAELDGGLTLANNLCILGIPSDVPIICFVDEAHNLTAAAGALVEEMQLGVPGRAILPIYAGMPTRTKARLDEMCGSSRLASNAVRTIGRLTEDEARTSIEGACRTLDVAEDVIASVASQLAAETQGFPSHITSAVCALARTMRGHSMRLPPESVPDCLAAAKELRRTYYGARLDAAGNPPIPLLLPLARAAKRSAGPDDWVAQESVRGAFDEAKNHWKSKRPAASFDAVLEACERAGAIRLAVDPNSGSDLFQFAAPSLADDIIERAMQMSSPE